MSKTWRFYAHLTLAKFRVAMQKKDHLRVKKSRFYARQAFYRGGKCCQFVYDLSGVE